MSPECRSRLKSLVELHSNGGGRKGRQRRSHKPNQSVIVHSLVEGNEWSRIKGRALGAGVTGNRMVRTGLLETSEQRHEGGEGGSAVGAGEKRLPGRGNSQRQGWQMADTETQRALRPVHPVRE